MYSNIVAPLFIFLHLLIDSSAWRGEKFVVNSKLPKQCGRKLNYAPENKYVSWDSWPWIGLLSYDGFNSDKCVCILIHPLVVLAGSLCVQNVQSQFDETLRVGFSIPRSQYYQNITVTHVDFSDFDPNSAGSIALLKLQQPILTSSAIQPICLWEENHDYSTQLDSHIAMMIGSDISNIDSVNGLSILQMPVGIIEKTKCEVQFRQTLKNTICVSYTKELQSCHYIGSAMMLPRLSNNGDIIWHIRGLLTHRIHKCGLGNFNQLCDLGSQRKWIESHFKPTVESSCGRRVLGFTPLITHGYEAERGDFPWHLALYLYAQNRLQLSYRCGATLISNMFAITAGHCVATSSSTYPPERFVLAMGKHDLLSKEIGARVMNISKVILHENYGFTSLQNDIALLKFEKSVTYNDYIQPICMWEETNVKKQRIFNMQGKIPGWGTNEQEQLSQHLFVASVPILDDTYCIQHDEVFYGQYLTSTTFCAGNPRGNDTNVCNGDSGGGLVLPITQSDQIVTWYLRGIVSLSRPKLNKKTCDPDYYAIYTDVAQFIDWINKKLKEN